MDLERVVTTHWHRMERYGFPKAYWYDHFRALYEDFQGEYARSKGKARWADKTPAYAEHIPFILELFPDAQIVHVLRDPKAVAASYQERWGVRRAFQAPGTWVSSVTAARQAGAELGPDQYFEIRFEDVVATPEASFRSLFAFLGERWEPAVLDYDRLDHDNGPGNAKVTAAARKAGDGAIDSRRVRPHRLNVAVRMTSLLTTRTARHAAGY